MQGAKPASHSDAQQSGHDAAPTGVAEAFAALLAGIVATPVAPPAGTGTATAAVEATAATTVAAAPAEAIGPAANETPATPACTADAAGPPRAPAADTPAPASPTADAVVTDPLAAASTAPNEAAIRATVVAQANPVAPGPTPDRAPLQVAPTAPAGGTPVARDGTTGSGTKGTRDDTTGSAAAPPPSTPAVAVPPAPDAAPPALATTTLDATLAPSAVVPAAVSATTVPVAVTSAEPPSLTSDRERFTRLVDGLEARLRVSGAESGRALSMTLHPVELGDVTVRLSIAADGQSATATLLAQHHQTGDLLAQAAGDLRQALADRGLRLDRLEVTAGPLGGDARQDGAPAGTSNPNQQGARRSHYAFDARSELTAESSKIEVAAAGTTHEGLYVLA